jgi:hypothetical protein
MRMLALREMPWAQCTRTVPAGGDFIVEDMGGKGWQEVRQSHRQSAQEQCQQNVQNAQKVNWVLEGEEGRKFATSFSY